MLTVAAFVLSPMLPAGAPLVYAQATRTWVSGVGDDVNPCSRTAPCKTFAGAISKTAIGGEIDALDPGGFGTVTITKAITIDGTAGQGFGSILASGTNGINISATANDTVTIRNLSINGAPGTGLNGISINTAKDVIIENVDFFEFRAGNARGISDTRANAGSLLVTNSRFTDNLNAGIVSASSNGSKLTTMVNNSTFHRNGFGILLSNVGVATVNDSTFSSNTVAGTSQTSATTELNANRSVFSGNATGVSMTAGTVRLSGNTIVDNTTSGVSLSGTVVSWGDNQINGNAGTNTLPAGAVIGHQ